MRSTRRLRVKVCSFCPTPAPRATCAPPSTPTSERAAFRRGSLYESSAVSAEVAEAWLWYQKGVDVGEPNALVRFAERDERNALTEADPSRRNALLLHAFTRYAATAVRAHEEDWPDDAWKNWRYRRATLARLLAGEGMMQQVGDAYSKVLEQRPLESTLWEKIRNKLHH